MSVNEPFTLRDEANAITAFAFRNGLLEKLHAGEPSELTASDKYSRITEPEMKALMIEASKKIADLLYFHRKDPEGYKAFIQDYGRKYCAKWER